MSSEDIDDAVLQGFQEGISLGLGLIPVAGPFVQVIFGHIWDLALSGRTAEQKKQAMDALFESVSKMINQALDANVADQARAYNATIAQLGQDYRVSVENFKEHQPPSPDDAQKVVVRFENCTSTLILMLNLFAQTTYMKVTVLSYGSALAFYVGLLREMVLAGQDCGYSKSEIMDFLKDIDDRLESAYQQKMYDAVSKLVLDSGEFAYPKMGGLVMDLGKLVGGLMNFKSEWHDGKSCLIASPHPDYYNCDVVNNKAYYQLRFYPLAGATKNYYSMPQVFMNDRAALHVYTDVDTKLQLSSFATEEVMDINFRAYYLVDYDEFDSSDVEVNFMTYNNPSVHQFHLMKDRKRNIISFPWVKMYYSNTDGGPWSTHFDKFSTNMRLQYDEYRGFEAEKERVYTISTKARSNATKNYYIIGFEVVPTSGVPDFVDSLFNGA